jgi:hypothetical protein
MRRTGRRVIVAIAALAASGCGQGSAPGSAEPTDLVITPSLLELTVEAGDPTPRTRDLEVAVDGPGGLGAPQATAVVTDGKAWLSAGVSGAVPPFLVTVRVDALRLEPGSYSGSVVVTDATARNSPVTIPVSLAVVAPVPVLSVNPTTVDLDLEVGGDPGGSVALVVTSSSAAPIARPDVSIAYTGASAWLEAVVDGRAEPYTVTLTPHVASLDAGTHEARVTIESGGAGGSPVVVPVRLVLRTPPPVLVVYPSSLQFAATVGEGSPPPLGVQLTSGNATPLPLPTATVTQAGTPAWLSATVEGAVPPYSLVVAVTAGSLPIGTYDGSVIVVADGAVGSPLTLPVRLVVAAPPPAPVLVVTPAALAFTATAGAPGSQAQPLEVTSGNGSALARPTALVEPAAAAGWLSAQVMGASAPYTVAVTASAATLPVGIQDARVVVASAGATGSPAQIPVSINVTSPGPGSIVAASRVLQSGQAGQAVADPPAVLVSDAWGAPAAGVAVTFSVVSGGGSLTGAATTTGADGVARVGGWVLGSAGSQRVQAVATGRSGSPVAFDATINPGGYTVTLRFLTGATPAQVAAFESARQRIEQVVTGDLSDVPLHLTASQMLQCGGGPALDETVDDLLILVRLQPIDGPGGILGQAGPCVVRDTGSLPVLGIMEFDTADLATLESAGQLQAVVLHEMLHVVGFGTVWTDVLPPLLSGAGGADPVFTGSAARNAFTTRNGGEAYAGTPVPVENTGGAGTRDSHWRESVFRNELMTGWLSGASQPLSATTVGSLADLGYVVDLAAADPFDLSTAALRAAEAAQPFPYGEILRFPIHRVDPEGTLRPTP